MTSPAANVYEQASAAGVALRSPAPWPTALAALTPLIAVGYGSFARRAADSYPPFGDKRFFSRGRFILKGPLS